MQHDKKNLSFTHKTTGDMGRLIPIGWFECLPGDKHNIDVNHFIRGMPTLVPIMDKIDIKINHFFVPNRILWENWEDWISMSSTKSWDNQAYAPPHVRYPFRMSTTPNRPKFENGRVMDYLGFPDYSEVDKLTYSPNINMFPLLAYWKIWIDNYIPPRWLNYISQKTDTQDHFIVKVRNLLERIRQTSHYEHILNESGQGNDFENHFFYGTAAVQWNHDYFSNCLPEPTLTGDVILPILKDQYASSGLRVDEAGAYKSVPINPNAATDSVAYNNAERAATIRDLRQSISMQQFLEKLNVSGGRYIESMKIMWGEDLNSDILRFSQYLGGHVHPLFVNEVESTADTSGAALGDLAGKPLSAGRGNTIHLECQEHGIYMCMAHIVPKRSYTNFLHKAWTRLDVFDYPFPQFENIGDQAVSLSEYAGILQGGDTLKKVFGYAKRYSEYDGNLSLFTGEMRKSMKHWHMGEFPTFENDKSNPIFEEVSPEFLWCHPRTDIFQVDQADRFIMDFGFNVDSLRKLNAGLLPGLSRI